MEFWKMNGAGNDFVILADLERRIPDAALPALAQRVCERRLSLGADGLMVVRPPEAGGDFRMLFFNSDGSVGEMCGNGARCACRFGSDTGLAPEEVQRMETTAGPVTGYKVDAETWRVRLNDPGVTELYRRVEAEGRVWDCAYVELGYPGLPHAVVAMDGLRERSPESLRPLGQALRNHRDFPKGANVNFYEILAPDRILLLTYERGVEDFTLACGTGAGSTVLALALMGKLNPSADVVTRGGVLHVDAALDHGRVRQLWLAGPAAAVARGELTEEHLRGLLPAEK